MAFALSVLAVKTIVLLALLAWAGVIPWYVLAGSTVATGFICIGGLAEH